MKIGKDVIKLAYQWQNSRLVSKMVVIIYFLIAGIGSSGLLSLFISTTQTSQKKSFSFPGLLQLNKIIFSDDIQTITTFFIGIYWILITISMMVNFIGLSEKGKFLISILIVFIDLFANIFTFYLLKAISCKISNLLVLLSIVTVLSTFLFTTFQHLFFIGLSSNPKNHLSHRYDSFIFINKFFENFIFAIHLVIELLAQQSQWWSHIYNITLILVYGTRLYSLIRKRYFLQNNAHYLNVFVTIGCLVLLIVAQVQQLFQTQLLEKSFFGIIVLIALFGMIAFYQYNQYRFQHVILMQINEVINSGQQTFYLDSLYELYQHKRENEWEFLVSGFCKVHFMKQQTHTIIQKSQQELKECRNLNEGNSQKFQNYIHQVLNYILSHSNNKQAIQECLYLKLLLFRDIFTVNTYIRQNTNLKQSSIFSQLSQNLILNQIESIIKTQSRKQLIKIDIKPIINLQSRLKLMRQSIIKDLNLKSQKWKQLCNNLCKSRQIQENISSEIQNLINFYNIYQQHHQNYKKSIEFQSLALFYFGSIIFCTKKSNQINKNLKIILTSQGRTKFNQQKLTPSVYTTKFCFLELNISQSIQSKINFTIKNFNKNAMKIFNCKDSKKLNGINVLNFFPDFLVQNVKKTLENVVKQNKGRIFNTYLINWERHVFEALVSFRVTFIQDKVSCIMLIEQKKRDNIIMLDSLGFIENVGSKYVNLFTGYNFHGLHFSTLLSFPQEFRSLQLSLCQQQNWYFKNINFVDIEQKKQQWISQTDRIRKWTENKIKKFTKSIQHSPSQQQQKLRQSKKKFDLIDYFRFIKKQRQRYNDKTVHGNDHLFLNDHLSSRQTNEYSKSLNIQIKYKKCKIQKKIFYVVQFLKVQKNNQKINLKLNLQNHIQNDIFVQNTQGNFQKRNKKRLQTTKKLNNKKKVESQKFSQDDFYQRKQQSHLQLFEVQRQNQDLHFGQQSTNNSYSSTSVLNRPLMNFSEQLLQSPSTFSDKRLIKFTFLSISLCLIVALTILVGYVVLINYLQQQRQIMQIDCTVSDTFQLTQLLYNSAVTYHIFRKNYQQVQTSSGKTQQINTALLHLDDIKRSYSQQRQLLLSLVSDHQAQFDSRHTAVTGRHYFEYLNTPAKWRGLSQKSNVGNNLGIKSQESLKVQNLDVGWVQVQQQQIQILTGQMIMLYDAHSNAVIYNSTNDNKQSQHVNSQIQKSLSLMKVNFPQLKRLNHYNLHYYGQLVNQTYEKINQLIYIIGGVHVGFIIVGMIVSCVDDKFRKQQTRQMIKLYTILPVQTTPKLYSYFTELKQTFLQFQHINNNKTNIINTHHHNAPTNTINPLIIQGLLKPNQIQLSNSNHKIDSNKNNNINQTKLNMTTKSTYSATNIVSTSQKNTLIFKMGVFGIVANFLFGYGMYKLIILNSTIDQVVLGIGSLMDAQNYLLQSYFDLKANFVIPNPRKDNQFFIQLLQNQQSVDVIFNKIALKSLQIFTKYDPQYSDDFVDLLRNDVCKVIKEQLNQIQYKQCIDNSQMKYFQNGIAMTMNYITRKIYQTILQLQQKANNFTNKQSNNLSNNQSNNLNNNESDRYEIYEILSMSQHREINQNLFYIFRVFQILQKRVNIELQTISKITMTQCQIFIVVQLIIIILIFPLWVIINYNKQTKQITKLYLSLLLLNQQLIGESNRVVQKATKILQFEHDIL